MTSARMSRKTFAFSLVFFLAAVFTGCGKNEKGGEDLRKGKAAYEIGKYDEAAMNFALAAQDGNAEAQFLLGKCYQDGMGVEQDIDKAEKWFAMAADQGHDEAKKIIEEIGILTISLSGGKEMKMRRIAAGTFIMTDISVKDKNSELVHHQARLTKSFYIGKTEVTQAQWKAVMGTDPSHFKGDDLPVENVSWNDAMEFCEKLNSTGKAPSGWKFALPTETQWEFAARGGNRSKGYKYSGSDKVGEVAWHKGNSRSKTHPVGQKKPNELGLYDMSGNVMEWCLDDWNNNCRELRAEFTRGNDSLNSNRDRRAILGDPNWDDRSIRGGCWFYDRVACTSAIRGYFSIRFGYQYIGFRVALVPESY